ncbi:MAG: AbrB/MazE/SpoVT family DNA-binding domain-containing protein [Nostoc sp.]|uniref:AbrB/MazE/SpoVT family DNA-binding domain-containing protein n=1 Tax=Nostoc sp. TaxID=1180 RepID=UPI002FF96D30
MQILKLRKIGNTLRLVTVKRRFLLIVTTPRNAQARRNIQEISRKSKFDKAMEAYKQVSKQYRNALGELAK